MTLPLIVAEPHDPRAETDSFLRLRIASHLQVLDRKDLETVYRFLFAEGR